MRELKTSFFRHHVSLQFLEPGEGLDMKFRKGSGRRRGEGRDGEGGVERREVLVAAFSKMCVPHKHLLQQQQQNLLKQQQQ